MAKTLAELLLGEDMEGGESFGDCIYNNLKNHFRDDYTGDPCAILTEQPGMIISDEHDDKLYHVTTGPVCTEIVQTTIPIGDDLQIIGGDGSDMILIPYEETTNDAIIWGLPVDPKRGLIFCDVADVGGNFAALITASTHPLISIVDLDIDSFVSLGWNTDDLPILSVGGVATKLYVDTDLFTDRILEQDNNTFIGVDVVGAGNLAHGAGSEGWYNTFIGRRVGYDITTGYGNVGVGTQALDNLTTGYGNVGIGQTALFGNAGGLTGHFNMAVGDGSLAAVSSGQQNVGMGQATLAALTTGDKNVAVGDSAGTSLVAGDENVFIGYRAGFNELGSDKLYISNSATATPLIYGEFDTENIGIGTATFGTNAQNVLAMVNGVAPTTSPADTIQMWSADVLAVAGKAGPHWRSEEDGMFAWHGLAGTINNFTYQGDVADDGTFNLPAITDACWGFIQAGNNEEYALFTVDDDGDVTLISNSANVVANADTDGNLVLGTAATQEPLVIRNRLGAQKNINLIIWYS